MNESLEADWVTSNQAKQLVTTVMDGDTNDASGGVSDSLNGETKPDPAKLARSAIIKQDVMLSGTSTQSPVSSVLTLPAVSMPTMSMPTMSMATTVGATSLQGALADSLFLSAVQSMGQDTGSATPTSLDSKVDLAGVLSGTLQQALQPQQLLGQPQVATPQIILTNGALPGQGASHLQHVQQILIPVSTGNGTQQLISIPASLAANAGGQIQLLTTSNGQILATSLSNLTEPLGLSLNGASTNGTSAPAAALAQNHAGSITGAAQPALTGLTQLITNAQGQILAIGSPQMLAPQTISITNTSNSLINSNLAQGAAAAVTQTVAQQAITVPQATSAAASSAATLPTSVTAQVIAPVVTQTVSTAGLTPSTANINQLLPYTVSNSTESTTVDGINLDEIKDFAKQFKIRRLSLGLTQTQVGQALSATEGPSYSQSAICRFEKLDITPKSAQKIKPVLERWMLEAEERYKNGVQNLTEFIGSEPSKKRKRRTSFTPQALEVLNEHFERNTHPTGAEMTVIAEKLNYDREVIRVWFCNKRQGLKNTLKKLKADIIQ